jgi:hypothetical protein
LRGVEEADVSMTIRTSTSRSSAATAWQSSSPSPPGMYRSRRTTSGRSPASAACRSSARAESASPADMVTMPCTATWRSRMARLVALSSTIRADTPRSDSRSTGGGASSGRASRWAVNQKVLPAPRVLSTPMDPPMTSTSRFEMARPRPVPP